MEVKCNGTRKDRKEEAEPSSQDSEHRSTGLCIPLQQVGVEASAMRINLLWECARA